MRPASQSSRVIPPIRISGTGTPGATVVVTIPLPIALLDTIPEVGLVPRSSVAALPVVLEVDSTLAPISLQSNIVPVTVELVSTPIVVELQ